MHEEITDVPHLVAVGEKILNQLSLKALLITRDAKGMSLFQRKSDGTLKVEHLPPNSSVVTDVTGAGDTVVAVFTLALAADAEFRSAALLSNLAGGIAVGKMGCATVTPKELLRAIETVESAAAIVRAYRYEDCLFWIGTALSTETPRIKVTSENGRNSPLFRTP